MDKYLTLKSREFEIGEAPEIISVLPLGHVVSTKGEFDVDTESFESMKAKIEKHGVDLVVDYEHQTLGGVQAPAAGWVKELILDAGNIKARIEWTPKALEYLKNREYRYISPVITVRKSDGKAVGLHSIALTNTPAIEGMTPLVNKSDPEGGQDPMNELLKTLAGLLDLAEDATEEQVVEALKALKDAAAAAAAEQPPDDNKGNNDAVVANKAICEMLGLKVGAPTEEVAAKIAGLQSAANSDPNLVAEVKALKAQMAERDADEAVDLALKDGKITPAQKEWAKSYALSDPKGFAGFVDKAPQVVPMEEIAGGAGAATVALKASAQLSGEAMLACKQLGVTAEDIDQYGKEG